MDNKIPPYENLIIFDNHQFYCGDRNKKSFIQLSKNYFKKCVQCNSDINCIKYIAAYRLSSDGDAYGTDVFICKSCNWITSLLWDEASSSYYFELDYFT